MKLTRYELRRIEIDGWRHYDTPIGRVPSVTTILTSTRNDLGQRAWRSRSGSDEAHRIASAAAARGTRLHAEVERFLTTGQRPAERSGCWDSIEPFLRRLGDVALVEGTVWHPLGFAGSVDCVAVVDGIPSVIDWKTASRPKQSDWLTEYYLQVIAYREAFNYVYDMGLVRSLIVIALPDSNAQIFEVPYPELQRQEFQRRFETYSLRALSGNGFPANQ